MHTSTSHPTRHLRIGATAAIAAMVLSACAHRSPRAEIEAAYGSGAQAVAAPESGDTSGAAASSSSATPPGTGRSTPGAVTGGGSATPSASTADSGADVAPRADASAGGDGGPAGTDAPAGETGGDASGSGTGGESAGGGGGGAPQQANLSPVKIGHVGTYSGIVGAIFAGGQQMAQAWAQDVNTRGGLNGHPVEIITVDDGGDPARAQSQVRDLVENRGVIAFVGNLTVFTTQAYQDYVQQNRIPVVGGTLYQPGWWEVPMLFPHGGFLDSILVGLADQAVRRGGPNIAALSCVEAYACRRTGEVMRGGAADQVGGTLVYDAEVSITQPNFTRECLSAQDAGAQAIVVAADVNSISRLARDCTSQGYDPLLLTASLAATDAAKQDPNLEGMVVATSVFPWTATDTSAAKAHLDVLKRYAPNVSPGGSTSQVWAAAKLLEAASANLPEDPTSEDIISGLYALSDDFTNEDLSPALNFVEDGPAPKSQCYSVLILQGGQFQAINGSEFTCL